MVHHWPYATNWRLFNKVHPVAERATVVAREAANRWTGNIIVTCVLVYHSYKALEAAHLSLLSSLSGENALRCGPRSPRKNSPPHV